ncbi:MAG: hypothetical protein LBE17_04500 [Treponema sp.]|nr:hypothetical protein [Treponema sp.]
MPDHQDASPYWGTVGIAGNHAAERDTGPSESLFSTLKNWIHSLLKERLYDSTPEEIFDKQSRKHIREISVDSALKFQIT